MLEFDIKEHRESLQNIIKTQEEKIRFYQYALRQISIYDGKVLNKTMTDKLTNDKIKAYIRGGGLDKSLVIMNIANGEHYNIDIRCTGKYQNYPLIKDKNRFDFENFKQNITKYYIIPTRKYIADIQAELAAGENLYKELAQIKAYYIEVAHKLCRTTITRHERSLEITAYDMSSGKRY